MRVLGVYNVLTALLLVCAGTAWGRKETKREGYVVKERHHVPRQWKRIGEALGGHLIQLQIGLKQEGFEELERHLFEGTLIWGV
jgi:tripeptidyl-peptidase-1